VEDTEAGSPDLHDSGIDLAAFTTIGSHEFGGYKFTTKLMGEGMRPRIAVGAHGTTATAYTVNGHPKLFINETIELVVPGNVNYTDQAWKWYSYDVGFDPSGNVHLVGIRRDNEQMMDVYYNATSGTWHEINITTSMNYHHRSYLISHNGTLHLFYCESSSTLPTAGWSIYTSRWNSADWTAPVLLTSTADRIFEISPWASNDDDLIYLTAINHPGSVTSDNDSVIYLEYNPVAGAITKMENVTAITGYQRAFWGPDIARAHDGKVFMLATNYNSTYNITLFTRTGSGAWQVTGNFLSPTRSCIGTRLASMGMDTMLLTGKRNEFTIKKYNGTWQDTITVDQFGHNVTEFLSWSARGDKLYVVWLSTVDINRVYLSILEKIEPPNLLDYTLLIVLSIMIAGVVVVIAIILKVRARKH